MSDVPMQEILVLQQIREAIGDPHGKLMQDEVVEVIKKLAADAERLDWLDSMNSALNERNGTVYGWKLILSPNIVRLLAEHYAEGRKGHIDLNDANARMPTSCRAAIDKARGKP